MLYPFSGFSEFKDRGVNILPLFMTMVSGYKIFWLFFVTTFDVYERI